MRSILLTTFLGLSTAAYTYIGCYRDDEPRALGGQIRHDNVQTVARCGDYCATGKYRYFAVQNSDECYCGSTDYARYGLSDLCVKPCPGNASEICGAYWYSNVYEIPENRIQYDYVGCYKDSSPMALSSRTKSDALLSVDECARFCYSFDYLYFSVQNTRNCLCGSTDYAKYGLSSNCVNKCPGNASQICGAAQTSNVYILPNYKMESTYLGCFLDGSPRALGPLNKGENPMSVEECARFCTVPAGYRYFGLQYSNQCFCGNGGYDIYGPTTDCIRNCTGNSSQICGGDRINSVYYLHPTCHLSGRITDPEGKLLSNLLITLFNHDNNGFAGSMRSNSTGEYNFKILNGNYELLVFLPPIYKATVAIVNVSSCTTLDLPTIIVSDIRQGIIGKIVDSNGNPYPAITVFLVVEETGIIVKTIIPHISGSFKFTNLNPGTYIIYPKLPYGVSLRADNTTVAFFNQDIEVGDIEVRLATTMLRGRVENNDGVGVSGCGVIITTSNGSAYNTKSESDGSFSFLVSLGNLTIATYPSDNTLYLPGDSISSYAELDVDLFIVTYLKPRYVGIAGRVYNDMNKNTIWDIDELVHVGASISVIDEHNHTSTAITDTNGIFTFHNLIPSSAGVKFVIAQGINQVNVPIEDRLTIGSQFRKFDLRILGK